MNSAPGEPWDGSGVSAHGLEDKANDHEVQPMHSVSRGVAHAPAVSFPAGRGAPLELENASKEGELPRLAINILPISIMFVTNQEKLVIFQKIPSVLIIHLSVSREGNKEK